MARIGAFRSTSFRLIWCSSLASAGAQWMERVATGWLALQTSGGPLGVGIVLAARMLPSLLLGLATGALADRSDRRRLLIAVAVIGAFVSATFGVLVGFQIVGIWQVAAFAFLGGFVQVSDVPARQALVVDTIGRSGAGNAIALNAVASRIFGAVGAFVGGLIIPALGVADCYFVVAGCYVSGAVLLTALDSSHRPSMADAVNPPFRHALAGAGRLILDHPAVRTLVLAAMACEVFGFSYMTVVPTFARDIVLAGPEGFGAMSAAASIGATLAVLALAAVPGGMRREPLLAGVYVGYGVALIALAASTTLTAALLAMLAIGACASAFDTLQQTLMQLVVPDDKRGRAAGVWAFSIGTAPVGHLEVGALASTVGVPTALVINGALVLAGALTLVARAPTYRFRRARIDVGA